MARKKMASNAPGTKTYRHTTADSLMRPEVGTQAQFRKKKDPVKYRYDSSLDPAMSWDEGHAAREEGEALLNVAFVFGPENGSVSERLVYEAAFEAHGKQYAHLFVVGFGIEPNARMLGMDVFDPNRMQSEARPGNELLVVKDLKEAKV